MKSQLCKLEAIMVTVSGILITQFFCLSWNIGYWSSGSRLADSAQVGGNGIVDYDLPEYVVSPTRPIRLCPF